MGGKKKRAGKKPGPKADGNSKAGQMRAMLAEGKSAKEIAEKLGTSTAYVYVVKSATNKTGSKRPGRKPGRKPSSSGGLTLASSNADENAVIAGVRTLGAARARAIIDVAEQFG
jgi:hypothetical protein